MAETFTVNPLTRREREVLGLMALEKSHKEIAVELGIVAKTVDVHADNIRRKLGVHSALGVVLYAIRNRLVEVPGIVAANEPEVSR